jgi:hypothetical protein
MRSLNSILHGLLQGHRGTGFAGPLVAPP